MQQHLQERTGGGATSLRIIFLDIRKKQIIKIIALIKQN